MSKSNNQLSFTYDGVTIVPDRVIEVDRRPEFSEDGSTYLWDRVRITVEGRYIPEDRGWFWTALARLCRLFSFGQLPAVDREELR